MRRLLVSVFLVAAFGLFLLLPEDRQGRWLDDGPEGQITEFHDPGLEGDGIQTEALGPRQTLSGYVRRPDGSAVENVVVRLDHAWVPEVRAVTDASGYFELTPDEPRGELTLAGPDWMLLGGELSVTLSRTEGYLLAVAPPMRVVGRVVDALDRPIKDAEILARTPSGALVPLGVASLPIRHEGQSAISNRAGHFELGPMPDLPGIEVEVRADGFRKQTVPLPSDDQAPFVIALEPNAS